MSTTRQTSFRAGEWAPSMWGRTDLGGYAHALRRCRNFFVSPHGTALSRPGTHFVAEAKTAATKVRLIPFVYSDTDSMVLEFGDRYLRFHRNGAPVMKAGAIYELPTTYLASQLGSLRFIQVGSVLFLVHGLHPPRELVRHDEAAWTLAEVDYSLLAHPFSEVLHQRPVLWRRENTLGQSTSDAAREWTYLLTAVYTDNSGASWESAPVRVLDQVVTQSGPMRFKPNGWYETNVAAPIQYLQSIASKFEFRADREAFRLWIPMGFGDYRVRVYRGRSGTFGLLGEVKATNPMDTAIGMFFEDDGREPDYTRAPPVGRKPFRPTNYPQAIGMYEQRMLLANFLLDQPGRIEASATNNFTDFDRPVEDQRASLTASSTVSLELASRKAEEVLALVGLDRLLVFTNSSVWVVEGAGGNPLSPTDLISARVQSEIGAARLDPITIGNRVLWVRAKGQGVRDLVYDWSERSYVGSDLSIAASHLVRDRKIVDWAYAEDPYGVVWLVRDDGFLLSLTYGEGGAAWALHETPSGVVESVCTVPEGDEDAVYLVVRRWGRRLVERMASRRTNDVREAMRLDSGRTETVLLEPGKPTAIITGLDHLNNREVWAVCDGRVVGPLRVAGGQVSVPVPTDDPFAKSVIIHVGLRFDAELELLDVAEAREKNKVVKRIIWEIEGASGLWTGESFDRLTEWRQKTVATGYGANELVTGEAEVRIGSSWNRHGRAVLRQVDPLPINVLGVTREGEVGR